MASYLRNALGGFQQSTTPGFGGRNQSVGGKFAARHGAARNGYSEEARVFYPDQKQGVGAARTDVLINDRSSDIRQLAKWFKGKNVMINVLQYNPTSNSKIRAPQKQEMVAFKHQLEQTGLEVTMRVSHGREIKAACGQLANTYNKAKKQQK